MKPLVVTSYWYSAVEYCIGTAHDLRSFYMDMYSGAGEAVGYTHCVCLERVCVGSPLGG